MFRTTTALPICCNPKAFNLLADQLRQIHQKPALLNGAIAIALHSDPDIDPHAAVRIIDGYADIIRLRVRGSQPQALLAHMHDFLFEEQGFTGNTNDYYNPENSYVPSVLKTKLGLPISLSLLYKAVADRLGFKCWGIGLPGHFLAGIEVAQQTLLIDSFTGGRLLTHDEAHTHMRDIFGDSVEWSDELLRPASHRHWLTRMLQNLLNLFGSTGAFRDVAAMLEMEILLWPDQKRLHRDLALVLARLGMTHSASQWLGSYLRENPDDPQKDDLFDLLHVLEK